MRLSQILCLAMSILSCMWFLAILDLAWENSWELDWDLVMATAAPLIIAIVMMAGAFW